MIALVRSTLVRRLAAPVPAVVALIALPLGVAGAAHATEGFLCPAGTDTVAVPYAFDASSQPLLAGTVCVASGTTRLQSLDLQDGWRAEVKSDGSKGRTEVRFTSSTGQRVELRYEPGKTVIK